MFEEEHPSPGLHSPTELYSLLQISAMGIVSSWALGGGVYWVVGYLAAMGILTPILLEGHRRHGHLVSRQPITRILLALSPAFLCVAIFCIGLLWQPVHRVLVGDDVFLSLQDTPEWFPSTAVPQYGWLTMLYFIAVYMAGIGLSFVALTTTLVRRILLILAINAAVLSIIGYIQLYGGLEKIFWYFQPVVSYFSTFTHTDHYATFALMWSIVLLGLIFHLRRQADSKQFLAHWGVLLIAAWAILASSVIVAGTSFHLGMLTLGIGWCIITESIYSGSQGKKGGLIAGVGLGSLLFLAGCIYPIYRCIQTGEIAGLPWEMQHSLWENAFSLFLQKPLFGWGIGSFQTVFALNAEVELPVDSILTPHSDLLHLLVEQGLVGLLLWTTPILVFAYRFIKEPSKRLLSAHLWVAIIVTLLLALVSFPLQNPAILLTFWVLLGASDAWLQVQLKEVSLETRLVFDQDELSRVPKMDKPRGRTRSRLESRQWFN